MGISSYIMWTILSACTSEKPTPKTDPQYSNSVFVLDIQETEADWVDFAYLSSIPTSTMVNQGSPAIISINNEPHPASVDLLSRLSPSSSILLNDVSLVDPDVTHSISATNASEYSLNLASTIWQSAPTVVFASESDYSGALLASSVSSLLEAPLIFSDNLSDKDISSILSTLQTTTSVGITVDGSLELPVELVELSGVEAVIDWLADEGILPQYLAVTNPNDRLSGRSQKSLFGSLHVYRKKNGLNHSGCIGYAHRDPNR